MADQWHENRVRKRACEIWEREGRPEGKATEHWVQAEADTCAQQIAELHSACNREVQSCFRLAAALGLWRRHLLRRQLLALCAAIILGGAAVLQVLMRFGGGWSDVFAGLLILAAVWAIATCVITSSGPDRSDLEQSTAEFFNLRDRFQRTANLGRVGLIDDFAQELKELTNRKDTARQAAPAAPEQYVRAAQTAGASLFDDGFT